MSKKSEAIFDYIFGLTVPGVKLELSRVERFMEILGNPHKDYPVIHIAGTNGKGSTASMLAAVLNAHGYRTGLFTSPHLIKPNERVRIGNQLIPDDFIIRKVQSWKPHIDALGITFFEVLTALGMVYFKEQKVDYAVFETGLGGRLDATNVVDPVASIITSISMDHENILGDTLEKIAFEKAGIIKSRRPLVLGKNSDEIVDFMKEICSQRESPFHYVPDLISIKDLAHKNTTQTLTLDFKGKFVKVRLPLMGIHQAENFCNVMAALDQLDLELDLTKVQAGLDKLQWMGRMQVLQDNPLVLYDVAHNQEGLERLMESLISADMQDTILIAAFNSRKNIGAMLKSINHWSGPVLFTAFQGYSAMSVESLIRHGVDADLILHTPEEAYAHARKTMSHKNQSVCFFGSHYLAESLFDLFRVDADYLKNKN